jgi:hypothetical protein
MGAGLAQGGIFYPLKIGFLQRKNNNSEVSISGNITDRFFLLKPVPDHSGIR